MQTIKIQIAPLRAGRRKNIFLWVALFSFILMWTLDYDKDFIVTTILPLAYLFFTLFIVSDEQLHYGIGTSAVVGFYCFRMCILPVICALGNFYLEPYKGDYIHKYNQAIYLMCIENFVVFGALSYFCKYYKNKNINSWIIPKYNKSSHFIIFLTTLFFSFFIIVISAKYQIDYFHFITHEAEEALLGDDPASYQNLHAIWYMMDLVCTLWRPLVSFVMMYFLIKRKTRISYLLIILIAFLNVLFLSDRRIYALLVGGFCFYYLTTLLKSKRAKKFITILLIICACLTVAICFYGAMNSGMWIVARTFQRYFSGPTLTAMALEVNNSIGLQFFDFFKLLLNDFHLFTGLAGSFVLPDYYYPIFGMSRGIWTPMTAGGLRYFSVFFFILLVIIVRYVVKCDYNVQRTDDNLYKMLYSYIAVSVSCYMIMYSLELIIYFMLSSALFFKVLIWFDSRKIKSNPVQKL